MRGGCVRPGLGRHLGAGGISKSLSKNCPDISKKDVQKRSKSLAPILGVTIFWDTSLAPRIGVRISGRASRYKISRKCILEKNVAPKLGVTTFAKESLVHFFQKSLTSLQHFRAQNVPRPDTKCYPKRGPGSARVDAGIQAPPI